MTNISSILSNSGVEDVKNLYAEIMYPGIEAEPNYHLVSKLGKYMPGKERVLDAGCGTGHLLLGLALSFPAVSYVGLDISEPSLEVAQKLFKKHGVPLSLHTGDFATISFQEKFDVIILNGTLMCHPEPIRALQNLVSYLSVGGLIYLMVYGTRSNQERLEMKEMLHLLDPRDSRHRFALYVDYLTYMKKSLLYRVVDLSVLDIVHFMKRVSATVRGSFTRRGVRSPIRKLTEYNQFFRDAFDVPVEYAYDTWGIRELVEGAGLEILEHMGITRENLSRLPPSWRESYAHLQPWEKARIMELLNPTPTSISLILRKKNES